MSSRRRPITSPPGGGTVTRPKRARSGPARRNDARISRASSASRSVLVEVLRVDADLVRTGPLDVCAEIGEELHHRLDVADARDVREPHLLRCEHTRGEDRERAVLVARGAHRPAQGAAALDHEGLHRAGNATGGLQLAHLRVSGRGVRSQECGSGRTARTRGPEHRRKARPRASRRCSPPCGSRAPRPRRAGRRAGSLAPAAPRR